jgi:hypothetical protein
VKCWGSNAGSQLGTSGNGIRVDADDVPGTGGATLVAVGENHSCAVMNGTVSCWGSNGSGQLGDGSGTAGHTAPVAITVTRGTVDLFAGANHTCALFGGKRSCWGRNDYGQLGLGITTPVTQPTAVYQP